MITYVANALELKLDIGKKFPSQWHKIISYCTILKSNIHAETPLQLKSYIVILEYQLAVHGIYIEIFINKKWKLDRSNMK